MYKPLSREFLLSRGYCCNNKCKNCPYKDKNKEKEIKNKSSKNKNVDK